MVDNGRSVAERRLFGKRWSSWHDRHMSFFQLFFENPVLFLAFIGIFILSLSIHEFCHALMARVLGDRTAERMNRLTVNPVAHIDPMGLLAVALLGFGWAKPVPFNPYNLKYPKWGPFFVAAAGPLSNISLGILGSAAWALFVPSLGPMNLLVFCLQQLALLNFTLALFNFIPLPPLDGSKAITAIFSAPKYAALRLWVEKDGSKLLFVLLLADLILSLNLFGWIGTGSSGLFRFFSSLV